MTTAKTTKDPSFFQSKTWKSRLAITLIVIAVVLVVVRLALPQTIIFGATSWLKERGIDSTIEDININIASGTVSLINAEGSKDNEPLFNIGLIDIHWHWTPLSEKTVAVSKVELDDIAVDIKHYSDEIIIGGVHIPLGQTKNEEESRDNEPSKPWAATLGEVVFSNLNICYLQNPGTLKGKDTSSNYIDYCVDLDEMVWGGTISYNTLPEQTESSDLVLSTTGSFQLNGLNITDNKLDKLLLSSTANTIDKVVVSGLNDIHIAKLEMNSLSALQRKDPKHKDAIRFEKLSISDIRLSTLNNLSLKSIVISKPGLYLVKQSDTDWEYQEWLPVSKNTEEAPTESKQSDTFKISIDDINIEGSDFCYLETAAKLDYCFTQESIVWDGSITSTSKADNNLLTLSGNLQANNTLIRDRNLDRHLIDINSLSIENFKATDIDNAQFANLVIKDLKALQRSSKESDSTVAFTNLTLNDTTYNDNKVSINTIKLDDLYSNVSKNKDGSWEHDKWLPKSDNKKAGSQKEDSAQKPLLISINAAEINTEEKILFIDNSTKPAMEVGLEKLNFTIKSLLSNKPKAKSPFKLFAKTTKHSSIDIAGTVQPFAEKVSFDAKGDLKGFDLRVASPAAKKSIGHIIKSGQLNADLKLLAVDGQLDSKVGLSLYQFKIKPMSKQDSAKLDKELGMPLNQTLVLLRDKDDSIHLDIPITGDINNPDFSPMNAIVKATTKAATVTLVTFYTPYGLIYAGGNALFDIATAMNFDPISFETGSSKLSSDAEKQLDNLAKLLTEKPNIHLTLCGMTNNDDTFALNPELKTAAEKDKATAAPTLPAEQSAALKKLATDRQVISKDYLIKESGINHDRLILCEPEHQDDKDAIAGVEISI